MVHCGPTVHLPMVHPIEMRKRAWLARVIGSGLVAALLVSLGCTPMPIYTSRADQRSSPREPSGRDEVTVESADAAKRRSRTAGESAGDGGEGRGFHEGQVLKGIASYYGPGFHGKLTANGERYDQNGLTCAHRSLPFGTILRVTVLKTGRTVKVRVNDRGPYVGDRIIDLSVGAARRLGMLEMGTAEVAATIVRLGGE